MKHFKEGRRHVFEFGEYSLTRIMLREKEYEEIAKYFENEQLKNCNLQNVSNNEVTVCPFCDSTNFDFKKDGWMHCNNCNQVW